MKSQLIKIKRLGMQKKYGVMRIIFFIILSFCYLIFFRNTEGRLILKQGTDAVFNFSRIMSLSNIWESPVNFHYYSHTGQIVNLMYPWITVYPMYWLIKLTGSIVAGYYTFFLVLTFITLEITYQCMKHMKQSKIASILTALLYTFAVCRTSDIYYRANVGEAISMTIFPIVLLGIYKILYIDNAHWKTLAIGLTLLVYTHTLSLIIAIVMIVFFSILSIIHSRLSVRCLMALLKAVGISMLLGLGFFIPMLQVLLNVKLNNPKIYDLYKTALSPNQLLQATLQNKLLGYSSYGIVTLISIILIILNFNKIKGFYRDSLIGAAFFTFMSTTLFPWGILQKAFGIFQFPWRFITVATLLLCVTVSELMKNYEINHSNKQSIRVLSILTIIIVVSHWGIMNGVYKLNGNKEGYDTEFYMKEITNNTNYNGYQDYNPAVSNYDAETISKQKICVNQEWHSLKYKVTQNTMTYWFNSEKEQTAILPVYVYPGEKVKQNGILQVGQAEDADGATHINLVSGKNKVKISYKYTLIARLAWIISLTVFFIFIGEIVREKNCN